LVGLLFLAVQDAVKPPMYVGILFMMQI
jgi:hypothetical protein